MTNRRLVTGLVSILLLTSLAFGAVGTVSADDEVAETVDSVNEVIDGVNERLEATNERLLNVDPIVLIEPVEASTPEEAVAEGERLLEEADRLQAEIFTQVVAEINVQSMETANREIANEVSTPEEARAEAEEMEIYLMFNEDAQEAIDSMNEAADGVEDLRAALTPAAEELLALGDVELSDDDGAADDDADDDVDADDGDALGTPLINVGLLVALLAIAGAKLHRA